MITQPSLRRLGAAAGLLLLAALAGAMSGPGAIAQEGKPKPRTPAQQKHLKEWADLVPRLGALLQKGKRAEAVALAERKVALDRKLFGDVHEEVKTSLEVLGELGVLVEDFPTARKAGRELLPLLTALYGAGDWRVREARLDLEHVNVLAGLGADSRRRLREAERLNSQMGQLLLQGKAQQALPRARKALDIRRGILGENNLHYAQSLNNLALLYEETGAYARALPLLEQARDLIKKLLTEDHPRYADSLTNLGALHKATGAYARALPLYEQARDLRKRLLTENHPDYARSLNNLATLYQAMGAYARALPLHEQARDLIKELLTEKHPNYADSLNNLGTLYQAMGAYARALPLYEQARDLRKKLLTEKHPNYARSLLSLGGLYGDMGAYDKALPLLVQARDLIKDLLTENHPDYTVSLTNLGTLYQDMGAYARALSLYEQARGLIKKLLTENHPRYADCLNWLGGLYRDMGTPAKALPLFEQARDLRKELLTENHPRYADSLTNLAATYQDMGAYARALPLLEQARDLYRELLTENHPFYARSVNNLAMLYRDMGAPARALPLYEQARDLRKKLLTENHPLYANSLNNLAMLYRDMGAYNKALPLLVQARDLRKRLLTKGHPDYAASLRNLAMLHQTLGHTDQAKELLQQASRIYLTFLEQTFSAQSGHERLASFARGAWFLHSYAALAAPPGTLDVRLYEHVLGWKGAVTARQAEALLAHDQPDLRPRLQRLAFTRAGLARLTHAVPSTPEGMADWRTRFDALDADKGKLEVELAQKSAAFRELRRLRQATAADVIKALPAGTALIDFFQYNHQTPPPKGERQWSEQARMLAFVLAPGRDPVCVPLGPAHTIDKAVLSWRQTVTGYLSSDKAGAALARLVWAPLRKHLAGIDTVLIAPDGVLCGLPFAALPGTKPGSFLLEELMIGYVTSGRHLLELELDARYPRGRGLLAVGDLDFGPPEKTRPALPIFAPRSWKGLPGTRPEVEKVVGGFRKAFPEQAASFLRGKEGNAAALKQQVPPAAKAPRWRYLHLATHGYFEPPLPRPKRELAAAGRMGFGADREVRTYGRNPLLRARLVLARANADPDGGYLTALEVSGLDLRGVELAVLSACDTGLGRVEGGEGVQSLQRGFQMAGAQALVVSQWSVHDAATSVLMEEFYANLWQRRMPKLKALTEAQRTVLRSPARVLARQQELRAALVKRGVPEATLAERSLGKRAGELPGGGRIEDGGRSPVAWWAAFALSGDPR